MEPGPLLASGRDGDIFEFGPGLVLRKTNDGRSIADEARIMEYVAEQGFPVPAIHDVRAGGTEIVMERIDGPMMIGEGLGGALRLSRMLGILADLHDQLHEIVAPDWLRSFGDGDRLLHLDLHPLNVMMSPTRGPVVIDWPNATRGDPMADVGADVCVADVPAHARPGTAAQVALQLDPHAAREARRSRGATAGSAFDEYVGLMADLKCLDKNMAPGEIRADAGVSARGGRGHRDDGSPRSRHPVPLLPGRTAESSRRGVSPSGRPPNRYGVAGADTVPGMDRNRRSPGGSTPPPTSQEPSRCARVQSATSTSTSTGSSRTRRCSQTSRRHPRRSYRPTSTPSPGSSSAACRSRR